MTDPTMSFVVLAYNGGDVLGDCVSSVLAQDGLGIDCVVVDNGSVDGSVEKLDAWFPAVRVVRSARNLGFSGGMNLGIANTAGELVVALNQDAVISPDFAATVRRVFAQDPHIGSVGGAVLRLTADGKSDEFDSGGWFLGPRVAQHDVGRLTEGQMDVFGVSGCCPAFRRGMLEDIQLSAGEYYDNRYFLNVEDMDVFFRAQLRSWRVVYVASVLAWHHRSWSTGGMRRFFRSPLWVQRLQFRNRYSTLIKNCPRDLWPRIVPGFALYEILALVFRLFRRPAALGGMAMAWVDVARDLPRLWRARRAIQARRTATGASLRALIRGI